jgi:hypothetical protein
MALLDYILVYVQTKQYYIIPYMYLTTVGKIEGIRHKIRITSFRVSGVLLYMQVNIS